MLQSAPAGAAQRADLVGEFLGATAIKTNELIDSALGGVLFVDEAYSLVAQKGDDPYGTEALQVLLKRMEDDRNRLAAALWRFIHPDLAHGPADPYTFPDD